MDYKDLRVLIVDDDEDDYIMIRDLLLDITGSTFKEEWIPDYATAKKRIMEVTTKKAAGAAIDDCCPGSAPVFSKYNGRLIRASQRPPFFVGPIFFVSRM